MKAEISNHEHCRHPRALGGFRGGMTLLEMLVTVAIFAIAASIVTPLFSDESRLRIVGAAQIVASDIELAQVMTISAPNEPIVVRFDADANQYWLAYAADPETPMSRADNGEPYLVTFGEGRARSAHGVTLTIEDMPADTLAFDATGALTSFDTTPLIHFAVGAKAESQLTLSIMPMTGSIVEIKPADSPKEVEVKK